MALRSLGSTLLAKSAPGTQLRSTEETRKQGAVASEAQSAQPSAASRQNQDQMLEAPVPEGTEKMVASQPNIQARISKENTGAAKTPDLLPGIMGAGATPKVAEGRAATGRPISQPTGMAQPRIQMGGTPVSGGANLRTQIEGIDNQGMLTPEVKTEFARKGSQINTPVQVTTPQPMKSKTPERFDPMGFISRVSADAGNQADSFRRNLLQGVSATVSDLIDKVGGAMGDRAPEMQVSEKLGMLADTPNALPGIAQNFDKINKAVSRATTAAAPKKVIPAVKQAATNTLRSLQNVQTKPSSMVANLKAGASNVGAAAKQAASKATSFFRSLFK